MELGRKDRAEFARNGYLVVPGLVDARRLHIALQSINHWLATGYDSNARVEYSDRTFAPELCEDPGIVGLLTSTGGLAMATNLVGRPLVQAGRAQIALRFPVAPGSVTHVPWPHLDGVATPTNGVPRDGRLHSFTLLAGVLLSDMPEPGHGNFTVWPGTHSSMARWFQKHGTSVTDPEAFLGAIGRVGTTTSKPTAVTGRAGDLILAHYLLLHGVGPHAGPGIRYAVFFRLTSEGREELGDAPLTDPWAEWDGMREVAAP